MSEEYQAFFERCCEKRLYLRQVAEDIPGKERLARMFTQLITLMDQTCLNVVKARLFSRADVLAAQQVHPNTISLSSVPATPIWLMLEEPLPILHGAQEGEESQGNERQVAAFFFRAPWSRPILRQALNLPLFAQPLLADVPSPLWHEWQLDLIFPTGESASEHSYSYDRRTRTWHMMTDHACPQHMCRRRIDEVLGHEVIDACEACQHTMEAMVQVFRVLLEPKRGSPLALKSTAWQQRLQEYTFFRRIDANG